MPAVTHASALISARPDAAFGTLIDVARLPEWNDAMTSVVDQPDRLAVGSEWVVEFHVLGRTWRSRSDPAHDAGSQAADG